MQKKLITPITCIWAVMILLPAQAVSLMFILLHNQKQWESLVAIARGDRHVVLSGFGSGYVSALLVSMFLDIVILHIAISLIKNPDLRIRDILKLSWPINFRKTKNS